MIRLVLSFYDNLATFWSNNIVTINLNGTNTKQCLHLVNHDTSSANSLQNGMNVTTTIFHLGTNPVARDNYLRT